MTPLHVPLESVASKLCHIYADSSVCSFSKTFSVSSVTWHTPPYIYIASRYPIDDALLTSKDRQDEGPWVTPSYTFAVPEDVVREALPIWDFLVAFGEQIDLTEFNFQQFQYGLLNCTRPDYFFWSVTSRRTLTGCSNEATPRMASRGRALPWNSI